MRPLFASIALSVLLSVCISTVDSQAVSFSLQGDSLTVDSAKYTRQELKGWQRASISASIGRHYWDAWPLLRSQKLGDVVVFALGTNDWQSSLPVFLSTVKKALAHIGHKRCLVMATIYDQKSISSWNDGLRKLAKQYGPARLQVGEWSSLVSRGKVRLADGVHPSRTKDWRARGRMIADSARACRGA